MQSLHRCHILPHFWGTWSHQCNHHGREDIYGHTGNHSWNLRSCLLGKKVHLCKDHSVLGVSSHIAGIHWRCIVCGHFRGGNSQMDVRARSQIERVQGRRYLRTVEEVWRNQWSNRLGIRCHLPWYWSTTQSLGLSSHVVLQKGVAGVDSTRESWASQPRLRQQTHWQRESRQCSD